MAEVKIVCKLWKNFSLQEMERAKAGLEILNKALNDVRFHNLILGTEFLGTEDTPSLILAKILSGADYIDPRADGEVNLQFVMYYKWRSKVIGYVLDGDRTIYVNRKFFGDKVLFASNALHEYLHLVGYRHSSARDFGSVPYRMNYLLEKWYETEKSLN